MAVIIQVEPLDCCTSSWGESNNPNPFHAPRQVFIPPIMAWIEKRHNLTRFGIASFETIAATFMTISTGQS